MTQILFILKKRSKGPYGSWNYSASGEQLDSGLLVSARQVVKMLDDNGIDASLTQVIDNNDIDRVVSQHKPKYVVIEAFWVVPDKFDILKKLHPNVTWIVRNHSKVDFLSHEGTVFGWALDYMRKGVFVASNSEEATKDFKQLSRVVGVNPDLSVFLPNYYNVQDFSEVFEKIVGHWKRKEKHPKVKNPGEFNVGCFGAIRPLKNHMVQALAAIVVANALGLSLRFHISSNRLEGESLSILKALRALFERTSKHTLVEHPWCNHTDFLKIVSKMDLVVQVSLSETFNIVAADAVNLHVPVVVSTQIPWLDKDYKVIDAINVQANIDAFYNVWQESGSGILVADQLHQLTKYSGVSKKLWLSFVKH